MISFMNILVLIHLTFPWNSSPNFKREGAITSMKVGDEFLLGGAYFLMILVIAGSKD